MMERKTLTLAALKELDLGKVDVLFRKLVETVTLDMVNRPMEAGIRKVDLQFLFEPVPNDDVVNEFRMVVRSKATLPPLQTKAYSMALHPRGGASFNVDSPDDVNQGTFKLDKPGDGQKGDGEEC